MNGYGVIGLNHKTAPVELRERCASDDLQQVLEELQAMAEEAAVVSTCNRFEIYTHGARDSDEVLAWLARRAGLAVDDMRAHGYVRDGRNACKHLFFVAASLDSLVVGETQIRRQVREAYQVATEAGGVGQRLHALFQAALRVSKEIAERTGVGRGNVSVAGAAADLAERVFGELAPAHVLVVGAGETAQLVMSHLATRGVSRFRVLNRTPEHAEELAARFQASAGGLDALAEAAARADILVTAAAGTDGPLVNADHVRAALRRRRGRPIVAIDLGVPRGIDPAVDGLDNVYRYDMDALSVVTKDALRHRRKEFLQCCTLVDAATLRLAGETRAREVGETIAELEERYTAIADGELSSLERRLPQLDEDDRAHLRKAIHRIVRKLLHMPVRALRDGSPEDGEVIRRAFAARDKGEEK